MSDKKTTCTSCPPPESAFTCIDVCKCLKLASPDKTVRIIKKGCNYVLEVNKDRVGDATIINAGPGIDIEGSGLLSNPYIVSNSGVLTVNGQTGDIVIDSGVIGTDADVWDYVYHLDKDIPSLPGRTSVKTRYEFRPDSCKVYLNGLLLTPGVSYDFIEEIPDIITILQEVEPEAHITVNYKRNN